MKIAVNGIFHSTFSAVVLAALTSCGSSGYGGGGSGITYTIGGIVTGLTGSGLILQNNGSGDLAVSSDGAFTFPTGLSTGAAYAVTVTTQPSSPTQNCVVTAGSGTVATSNVTSVTVTCATAALFTVGGIVTELEGSGLVLQNNSGDDLSVSASGAFTFASAVANGAAYAVTVRTQPSSPAQTCSIGRIGIGGGGSGTGTIQAANVENIWITCGLHFAYAANAGDNNISQYTLNALTGELTAFSTPVATGTSPYAITGSPDKHHVYVVNEVSNNISAYAVNATSGALTEIAGSPFAAGTDPQALAFESSGTYLYVANNGSNEISAYSVDANTGSLTPLSPATYATGASPSAVAVDNTGEFVFVANNGGTNDISVFAITAATGALTPVVGSPFAAGANPHGLSISSFNSQVFLYTANTGGATSTISTFSVDPSTGALTAMVGSPFDIPVSNYMGIYSGYGDSLFVTTGDTVVGYFINSATGQLISSPGYTAATGVNAFSVTIHRSTTVHLPYLYVGNDGAASISAYKINDVDGTLTAVPGSPFAAGNNPDFIVIL